MLPFVVLLLFSGSVRLAECQRFICPSNLEELMQEINGTLLKRMDDVELSFSGATGQVLANIEGLGNAVSANRDETKSAEFENIAKLNDLETRLLIKIDDDNGVIFAEFANLAKFIDDFKAGLESLSTKVDILESGLLENSAAGFKDLGGKIDSLKAVCQGKRKKDNF